MEPYLDVAPKIQSILTKTKIIQKKKECAHRMRATYQKRSKMMAKTVTFTSIAIAAVSPPLNKILTTTIGSNLPMLPMTHPLMKNNDLE